jgi:hypothetical protein
LNWQSHRLLPIRHENQGVCVWAAHLDGSADPPVLIDVDTQGREWHSFAPTFSAYVYACIWDYRRILHRSALVQAQNRPLSAATAEVLGRRYRTELSSYGWPASEQHRFVVDDESAILIWASPGQADWFVAGDAEASLERALRAVWLLDGVGANLYECTESGKAVLNKIRGKA